MADSILSCCQNQKISSDSSSPCRKPQSIKNQPIWRNVWKFELVTPWSSIGIQNPKFQKVLQIDWFFVLRGFSVWRTRIWRNFLILTAGKGRIGHGRPIMKICIKWTGLSYSTRIEKIRDMVAENREKVRQRDPLWSRISMVQWVCSRLCS
jgi:hypothetical protein